MKEKGVSGEFPSGCEAVSERMEDVGGGGQRGLPTVGVSKDRGFDLNKEVKNVMNVDRARDDNSVVWRGIDLDLNMDDASCSGNRDPFNVYENSGPGKMREVSECGSAIGGLAGRDPMRIWDDMRQNNFLSLSYGGIPLPMPKQLGKRAMKNVDTKRVKRAQVDVNQTAETDTPCGLLNGLNPGILSHVRNKKQVRSIIEAVVRSENQEDDHPGTKQRSCLDHGDKEVGNMAKRFCGTQSHVVHENDRLGQQSCASDKRSERPNTLSNKELENISSVSSLSVKAARVAVQWLELLHQDIKWRLEALRKSKDRVRAVITMEFPLLVSKEFSSGKDNDGHVHRRTGEGFSSSSAEIHEAKWGARFNKMHETLCEEENKLVIWLNQVIKMRMHCKQGLGQLPMNILNASQLLGLSASEYRTKVRGFSENDLATMAAAAAIYSTCNFVSSKENAP